MSEHPVTFSVIVPTYNRLTLLRKTLESLFRQDFPDYEIVVVNDGSVDGTREYLEGLQTEGRIRCFHQPNAGPARGRNLGIANARHEFIALIDDDCLAPPDWLHRYAGRLSEWQCDGIGGWAHTGNPENIYAVTNDHIMNFFKSKNSAQGRLPFLTSNNAVYRKSSLDAVGGFDPGFRIGAEERDLNLRLVESGATLRYDPAISITHHNDETLRKFVRHQIQTGRGSRRLYAGAWARGSAIPAGARAGEYLALFASSFSTFGLLKGFRVFILILLAQVAVTVGYFAGGSAQSGRI